MTYAGKKFALTPITPDFAAVASHVVTRLAFTSHLGSRHNTVPRPALLREVVASTRFLRVGQEAEALDAVEFCGVGVLKGESFPVW